MPVAVVLYRVLANRVMKVRDGEGDVRSLTIEEADAGPSGVPGLGLRRSVRGCPADRTVLWNQTTGSR